MIVHALKVVLFPLEPWVKHLPALSLRQTRPLSCSERKDFPQSDLYKGPYHPFIYSSILWNTSYLALKIRKYRIYNRFQSFHTETLGLKKKNISIHVFTTDFYHSHTYIKKKLSNYQYIHILTDYFYLHNSVLSSDDLDYELKRTPL